jgi:hypothetical protein
VTLGGQSFPDGTTTGRLTGQSQLLPASRSGHGYRITLPPASATLLTVPAAR